MKRKTILSLLAFIAILSNVSAATFKIVNVSNGGNAAGSTVESVHASFTVELPVPAQAISNKKVTFKTANISYTASKVYPNEYYTSIDGSLTFDFWGGELSSEGVYTLTIPAGTYTAENGDTNEEYVGTWTIKLPSQFTLKTMSNRGYDSGATVKELSMYFDIVADSPITYCDYSKITVAKSGSNIGQISGGNSNADGTYSVAFRSWYTGVENGKDVGSTTTSGTYTLTCDKGAFRNANNEVSAPATFTFTVSSTSMSTPKITLQDGKISFDSDNVGATYEYSYSLSGSGSCAANELIALPQLSVSAKAVNGSKESNTVTKTFSLDELSSKGDINGDGKVDILDITTLVNKIIK